MNQKFKLRSKTGIALAIILCNNFICYGQQIITTVAGGAVNVGDGGPATTTSLLPQAAAVDAAGNLYIADIYNNTIRKVDATTGIITTVAGNGSYGFSGDNESATTAQLNSPQGVALDANGNLYIADGQNHRVRKVNVATGIITTIVGDGTPGSSGDNGAATSARLNNPHGIALDASNNLYIADAHNSRIRMVNATNGVITTVAGGTFGFSGDNGAATSAQLSNSYGVSLDASGNLYIADTGNRRIRKVTVATGIITTVAGGGFSDDNETATNVQLSNSYGISFDAIGNLYIAETGKSRIRKVNAATGIITTVAGDGTFGFSGDNGAATSAQLNAPQGVASDAVGNLYIVDVNNNRVRKLNAITGIITTIAGDGNYGFSGDSGIATSAQLNSSQGVASDESGNLYFADANNNRIRKVDATTGIITTIAGNGMPGFSGDNGTATNARLNSPQGVALDASGNLYIADATNHRIRKVDKTTGIITTVAGIGGFGFGGDNGPATSAPLSSPKGVSLDASGNLYIVDPFSSKVRKVTAVTGIITTVAGNGSLGYSGDNGPATSAQLNNPYSIALDVSGNLYIADAINHRVRMVNASTGIINTVAGNGIQGFGGDNGAATSAQLNTPNGIALDANGNLYIADVNNRRIRKVSIGTGIITTIAGTGEFAFGGDNGLAASAKLSAPYGLTLAGLTLDEVGNLYATGHNRIRRITNATKENQTIIFTTLPDKGATDPTFELSATASSGLAVTYTSSNLAVATVNGNTVTIVDAGTTTIIASQSGNAKYNPAIDVKQFLTVKANLVTGDIIAPDNELSVYPVPSKSEVIIKLDGFEKGQIVDVLIHDMMGRVMDTHQGMGGQKLTLSISNYPAGTYAVRAVQGSNRLSKTLIKD